jgi:hypothetical protein
MAGQGTNILALDYNNIQSKIAQVLGQGSGTFGYNQTVLSGQVSVNQKITALQWQNLYNDLIAARTHQTGADETANLNYPTTSTTIKESDRAAYIAYAGTIEANRLVVPPAGQATLETYSTSTRTADWNGTITHSVTLSFADVNSARAYFNAGGNIQISASFSPNASNLKNNSWQTMLNNMGVVKMTYNATTNTGSGTGVTASAIGYQQLTTGQQRVFQKTTETPTYSPNAFEIYVNVNGTGSQVIFSIQYRDLSGQPNAPWGTDENITGTLTSQVQGYRPSGASVSITAPTVASSGP